jgi:protein-S-isoprenylcysteine O-methyltransferase Ste14
VPAADPALVRALGLFVPIAVTLAIALWRRPGRPALAGALLGTIWNLPALLLVHLLAARFGWWSFGAEGGLLDGFPVDLWLGWALLWGAAAHLAAPRAPVVLVAAAALWLDVLLMARLAPVVELAGGWRWLWGEAVAGLVALVPALLLARSTERRSRLAARTMLQVLLAGALMLWLLPVVTPAATGAPQDWLAGWPAWRLSLLVQLLAVPTVLALSAVQEFAARGRGTPVPYDPPQALVTTGPYAYVANPMQTGMALLLAGWGAALGDPWVVATAPVSVAYGAGLAAWHEGEQLRARFGADWAAYRAAVRPWWPRWRPYIAAGGRECRPMGQSGARGVDRPAELRVAATCAACSQLGAWLAARRPVGLRLAPAETAVTDTGTGLRRLTYVGTDGHRDQGVRALARALEHVHLGWALLAWTVRLPGVAAFAQLLADAVGTRPRELDPTRAWHAPWATDARPGLGRQERLDDGEEVGRPLDHHPVPAAGDDVQPHVGEQVHELGG